MNLALYYRVASLVILQALTAWLVSLLFIVIKEPVFAFYTMMASTFLSATSILIVGFARLLFAKKKDL